MRQAVIISFFLSSIIQWSNSARILGIIPTTSYSHQIVFQPLWKELSLRGHQVTVLTTNPMNDSTLTNLTEIDLHFSYELWNKNVFNMIKQRKGNMLKSLDLMVSTTNAIQDQQLQHPDVQALIKNENEHFDLVIVEFLMPTMIAFSERFKCPFIGVTSLDAPINAYRAVGNPTHPVLNPEFMLPFDGKLTFFERVLSLCFNLSLKFYADWYLYPLQQQTIQKNFGEGYPSVQDLQKRMSMLFVNADPVFHRIRPLVPAVVQIGGGSHRQPPKPLPKDLQILLDGASQGFIYFSLGTNVKSKDLPKKTMDILMQTFAELPYLILWKFELEDLPNTPKNVKIAKWYPQQDILKHPNIKLFITQGGIQSIDEAVYDHVPILGMPVYADQPTNVKRMVAKGFGLSVDYTKMDKESLKETILEVIDNPKYRNQIKKLAELARDQPMTGLERAVWWTEYVLRHKGAKHLKSGSVAIPFYQFYLLDVIGICLAVTVVLSYLLFFTLGKARTLMKFVLAEPKLKYL